MILDTIHNQSAAGDTGGHVVEGRVYARNNIEVLMTVKHSMSDEADETSIKVKLDPSDTIFDIYEKINVKIDEVKDMLPQKPERMESVEEPKKSQLVQASYDVVGCILEVYKQLGSGLPEYIYQEALAKQMVKQGLTVHKEFQFHPEFNGEPFEAYLKMDLGTDSGQSK